MKIVAFIGSKNRKSSTSLVIEELVAEIRKKTLVEFIRYDSLENEIKECIGCCRCFNMGQCPLSDDIAKIKDDLGKCSLIILGSPVYLWQVTGSMKIFIDRISSWSHLYKLTGKFGVAVNTSASNGNAPVSDYLKLVLESLGTSVLSNISFNIIDILNAENRNSIISYEAERIVKLIKNEDYRISQFQEQTFSATKKELRCRLDTDFEKIYWKNNGYFEIENYRSLFNRELKINL